MAQRHAYVDLNLNKQALIAAKVYPLSTANRTALSLGSSDAGLLAWDTDLNELYAWNGTAWVRAVTTITGAMTFRGGIAASANPPSTPANGDTYVFTSAGTLNGTWSPVDTVAIGDQAIWDSAASVWRYIQGNVVSASTSVEGTIQLATQTEVSTGTNAQKAVTPSTLAGYVPDNALTARLTRRFATNITSLVVGTPQTVTHNLNLANQNDVVVECWQGGLKVELAVSSSSANAVIVESNVALSNVRVICEG
ncbi:hypothetical protein [Stenomitos frigidus]|uniref:Uncharacterized protein n=1 Tax=Stenomitos frigidus ULC18 TaxID=2107698 RepID=A0A2T1E0E6_9CYAN|nr:hypothetical protein [Stenomitos frigidus]PSB26217.1 hypothetical protein C7B82_20580 [Stenomitos frigidus ULC18]